MIGRVRASLRIFGDDFDPDEMTRQLGKRPSGVQRRGQPVVLPSGQLGRIAPQNSWFIRTKETSPGDLDLQVATILEGTTADLAVWRRIGETCQVDLFCGFFMEDNPEEISLSPDTLRALGDRGITLSLDIYGPTDDEP